MSPRVKRIVDHEDFLAPVDEGHAAGDDPIDIVFLRLSSVCSVQLHDNPKIRRRNANLSTRLQYTPRLTQHRQRVFVIYMLNEVFSEYVVDRIVGEWEAARYIQINHTRARGHVRV